MSAINRVIVVFKTHFDIGFTLPAEDALQYYATDMLERALETLDQTADWGDDRYMLTLPAWPLGIMLGRSTPRNRARLEAYIREGRVAWHALAFTSHTDFASAADVLWNLREGRRLSARFGRPARAG